MRSSLVPFRGVHPGVLPVKPQPNFSVRYDGYEEESNLHYWERLDENGNPTEWYISFKCPYPHPANYTVEHDGEEWVWNYHSTPQHEDTTGDYED